MGLFGWNITSDDELQKQNKLLDKKRREINSLNAQIRELEEKIDKKEEDLDYLEYRLRNTQSQIDFAVCELNNLESVKDSDFSLLLKDNPTKEEMAEAVKMYTILRFRYDLIKTWMNKYEKDFELAKTNLDLFIKERRDEIRSELMHELYQRASHCESSMLRHLSSFVENADIEEIRNQLKIHKHITSVS